MRFDIDMDSPYKNENAKTNTDLTDPPIRLIRGSAFNNDVYQNLTSSVQNSEWTNGDQTELFYSPVTLDQSETSMLVSARFESRRPVNN